MLETQETDVHIDFETPLYVIHHYYISGTFAFIFNCIVVYLILNHSGKLDSYRYYLLAFQISCIVSDLNISIFMQPIMLFPIPAGYAYGIGHRTFSLSSHTIMTIFTLLLSGQIEVLTICSLRKHKAIMNLRPNSNSSDLVYPCIYALCISYSCSIAVSIYVSTETREEQLRFLYEYYPSFAPKFEALEEFQLYVFNKPMIVFYIFVFGGTTKTTIVVSILVLRMLKTLREVQNQLSSRTLAKHRTALRCLIMQFLTTPIAFFPPCVLAIVVWWPTQYSQVISWFAFMCMPSHSIFNSTVVVLTYPEFRKALIFWRKPVIFSVKVSSVRGSQNAIVR